MSARHHFTFFCEPTSAGFALTIDGVPVLAFDRDGDRAFIPDGTPGRFDVDPADLVRWGAPHALALRERPCLHGAAVDLGDSLALFLGTGGAGKSTLARALGAAGLPVVLDDLLVFDAQGRCDAAAERIVREWAPEVLRGGLSISYGSLAQRVTAAPHWRAVGLVAIVGSRLSADPDLDMLGERDTDEDFRLERLTRREAALAINEHRFGSHPLAAAWQAQLRTALHLADAVPVLRVSVIDGLERLYAAAPRLGDALRAVRARP